MDSTAHSGNSSNHQDIHPSPPPDETELAKNKTSPLKKTVATRQRYLTTGKIGEEDRPEFRYNLSDDMMPYFAEVEADGFLETHLPGEDFKHNARKEPLRFNTELLKNNEREMAEEFVHVASPALKRGGSKPLVAKITADLPDSTESTGFGQGGKKRPDVVLYPNNKEAVKDYALSKDDIEGLKKGRDKRKTLKSSKDQIEESEYNFSHLARTCWSWVCVPVELKADHQHSAFGFGNDPNFLPGGRKRRGARGQLADYAARILQRQHLLFFFMIAITRNEARLMRWDRAGAIVTQPLDLRDPDQADKLLTFLYRLSRAKPEQRGCDRTVQRATKKEIDLMREAKDSIPEGDYRLKRLNLAMAEGWPVYKVLCREDDVVSVDAWRATSTNTDSASSTVPPPSLSLANIGLLSEDPDPFGPGTSSTARTAWKARNRPAVHYRCFLICKHDFSSDSPIGRGTRGYLAYDMKTGKFVYLKDSWRVSTGNSEIKVYQRLHERGVENIATPIYGGDVADIDGTLHRTLAQKHNRKAEYIHCRLVVEEIGESILDYPTSKDLVAVMYGAIIAHQQACEKAKVMHRDISEANMLMIPDPKSPTRGVTKRGILIDWDLCKLYDELMDGAKQSNRSGTWQFMSALLLLRPGFKQHTVADDLESFMHVLNWICLRYHDTLHEDLQAHVSLVFDGSKKGDLENRTGGGEKFLRILKGIPSAELSDSTPLQVLVDALVELCQAHYNATDLTPYAKFFRKKAPIPASWFEDGEHPDVLGFESSEEQSENTHEPVAAAVDTMKYPPFSTHEKILRVFEKALLVRADVYPIKQDDKFAQFAKIDRSQYSVHSSFSGSKRYSEELGDGGDEEQPLAKKLRPARTKQQPSHTLGAIIENEATRDQPVAGGSQAAGHRDG
ncbi:predicted protein [Postia placenta Mad-698-R]|uniref:Fungal-type protein kinase domain-containing protein n=1 Tax=Postia placenta MAD-698-R-SB12 TaxID=670580 RepID=A0A1X6N7D8_9APHY|nr:hypothetical protein POSPLADRAFT_1055168 [Postia placenta MAD-698-R-SB12]EED83805.1 predicted protein [Postia placenta Mad-698-R]OSX64548.1 hypothetical protein POSPLADRAFT_1055168 [Postia placenta MAD-698-R-SB12]